MSVGQSACTHKSNTLCIHDLGHQAARLLAEEAVSCIDDLYQFIVRELGFWKQEEMTAKKCGADNALSFLLMLVLAALLVSGLDNGLARTPPSKFNTFTSSTSH